MRGHGQDPDVSSIAPLIIARGRGKRLFCGEGVPSGWENTDDWTVWHLFIVRGFLCNLFLLILSVINIFVVTVRLLVCMLFTVNCSYHNPWSFPSVPPAGGLWSERGRMVFSENTKLFPNHENNENLFPNIFFYTKVQDSFIQLWQISNNTNSSTFSLTGSQKGQIIFF